MYHIRIMKLPDINQVKSFLDTAFKAMVIAGVLKKAWYCGIDGFCYSLPQGDLNIKFWHLAKVPDYNFQCCYMAPKSTGSNSIFMAIFCVLSPLERSLARRWSVLLHGKRGQCFYSLLPSWWQPQQRLVHGFRVCFPSPYKHFCIYDVRLQLEPHQSPGEKFMDLQRKWPLNQIYSATNMDQEDKALHLLEEDPIFPQFHIMVQPEKVANRYQCLKCLLVFKSRQNAYSHRKLCSEEFKLSDKFLLGYKNSCMSPSGKIRQCWFSILILNHCH